jgi:hypothetical protein
LRNQVAGNNRATRTKTNNAHKFGAFRRGEREQRAQQRLPQHLARVVRVQGLEALRGVVHELRVEEEQPEAVGERAERHALRVALPVQVDARRVLHEREWKVGAQQAQQLVELVEANHWACAREEQSVAMPESGGRDS